MDHDKPRAGRNKTLTISESEAAELQSKLLTADTIDDNSLIDSIIRADMLEVIDRLPDHFADLIIIDPPYNLERNFGTQHFSKMQAERYEEYLRSWFGRVCRKLKADGTLYMCGDWHCSASMQRVMEEELTILNRITWQRDKGRGAKQNWKNVMEDIWFAVSDPKNYHFDIEAVKVKRKVRAPYTEGGKPKDWTQESDGRFRLTCPPNIWDDISIPFWSMAENTDHPTQKPEKLYAKLILASSEPGDIIFDPFMGSGTAPVVAKKLGRHYCGIELNEEYCLWALKRLQNADHDSAIQGYRDGVFWERNTCI